MAWSQRAPLPKRLTVKHTRGETFIRDEILEASENSKFVIIDLESAATRLNAFVMAESDLVIIPMGDEQQDAEAAIETLAQVNMEAKLIGREIPVRILFARTQAAVKSRLARSLNAQVRDRVGAFTIELHARTAFAALHSYGGALYNMKPERIAGLAKAIGNAEAFTEELQTVLKEIEDTQRKAQNARSRQHSNPTVQMSIRMPEASYEQFREICRRERRTNGEQLEFMMATHLRLLRQAEQQGHSVKPFAADQVFAVDGEGD